MIMLKLKDIRSAVKRKMDDDGIENELIDENANFFINELFDDIAVRYMESSDTISAVAGDYLVSLPRDFASLLRMGVIDADDKYSDISSDDMDYVEFTKVYPNYKVATQSKPLRWSFFGEDILLQAPLDDDYTFDIDYMRSPKLLVRESDTCDIPERYKEMVVLGVVSRIMRINEDYEESSQEESRLKKLREDFRKAYGRGSQLKKVSVIRTNRRGTSSRQFYGEF